MSPSLDSSTHATLRQFFSRHTRGAALGDDDNIFSLGFLNSLLAVQLIQYVEQQFHVEVRDEDLDLANFQSISAIAGFVSKKREPKGL